MADLLEDGEILDSDEEPNEITKKDHVSFKKQYSAVLKQAISLVFQFMFI